MAARRHLEDDQAVALIQWRNLHMRKYPRLQMLVHLPMGGKRNVREAARLKAQGARAGVSDYGLFVPSEETEDVGLQTYGAGWKAGLVRRVVKHGLFLELKQGKNKATEAQLEWLRLVQEQGYAGIVCTGWVAAARAICDYLGLTGSVRP
jgi:hypothetical protein